MEVTVVILHHADRQPHRIFDDARRVLMRTVVKSINGWSDKRLSSNPIRDSSYGTFSSLNTFCLVDAAGGRTPVRLSFAPMQAALPSRAGDDGLFDALATAPGGGRAEVTFGRAGRRGVMTTHYPLRTRILPWLTALLVFAALLVGFVTVNSLGSYARCPPCT